MRYFVAALVLFALVGSCARPPAYVRPTSTTGESSAVDPSRVHAVLINGGGSRSINYQSHVIHLREVLEILESGGVPLDQIAVFASDGEGAGKDLATRELRADGDDGWLLDGTPLERSIGRPMEYVSTGIDGVQLRPATQASLAAWFSKEGDALKTGDVVFLYVTDHGTQGSEDAGPRGNAISLWGKKEHLDVGELADLVDGLPGGVQVIALMSQCFSGGFAQLIYGDGESSPDGSVCGYFSTTDDREAYGCYAENLGDDNVGHSIRFLEGLGASGRMPTAHAHAVVNDHTPDVPLRTSDEYVRELLEHAAWEKDVDAVVFADELLAEAWADPGRYEPQIRLVDRVGRSFGFASPRSLAEIDTRLDQLPRVSEPLAKHSDAWNDALRDLSRANLGRFLEENPDWEARLAPQKLAGLEPEEARSLGSELVAELGPSTRGNRATYRRLDDLRERASTASGASYRMSVREAALLRMQTVLIDIAAQVYLQTRASAAEREAYEALLACEDLALPIEETALADRDAFPAYADDIEVAKSVLPAWMGIQFKQASPDVRSEHGLRDGAVTVQRVYPASPAETAGIEPGDVILGPPGEHFAEPRQIREWTMLSKIDVPRRLDIVRADARIQRTLVPGAHPGRFPDLPAPPGPGDTAPPLRLSAYRADVPATLGGSGPHMLFFWATWCLPCKAALPELMAYSESTGVPVVAITDERPAQLDPFFEKFEGPFPETVGMDHSRATFLAYGVSGTPTFVLVGGDGVVQSASTGYSREKGLSIEGWRWGG